MTASSNSEIERVQRKVVEFAFGTPLITNVLRGHVAEAIVALALEPEWKWCAKDYASWDFQRADGVRLEVKQSAARQSWAEDNKPSQAKYDIRARTGYWDDRLWISEPGRAAHLYIFAHHPIADQTADHRDPKQWNFVVIVSHDLPDQKTLSLQSARKAGVECDFDRLAKTVREAALRL